MITMTTFKHLSLDDRIFIQEQLALLASFKSIGALLHIGCYTFSKKIKNHVDFEKMVVLKVISRMFSTHYL